MKDNYFLLGKFFDNKPESIIFGQIKLENNIIFGSGQFINSNNNDFHIIGYRFTKDKIIEYTTNKYNNTNNKIKTNSQNLKNYKNKPEPVKKLDLLVFGLMNKKTSLTTTVHFMNKKNKKNDRFIGSYEGYQVNLKEPTTLSSTLHLLNFFLLNINGSHVSKEIVYHGLNEYTYTKGYLEIKQHS